MVSTVELTDDEDVIGSGQPGEQRPVKVQMNGITDEADLTDYFVKEMVTRRTTTKHETVQR